MSPPHQKDALRPAHPPALLDTRVMVVLRGEDEHQLTLIADTLVTAGLTCIEVTFTVPRTELLIRALIQRLGHNASIGAGTVTHSGQAQAAMDAGAHFLVSPTLCPDITAAATGRGVPHYPGAFSPTEVLQAWEAGAAAVKLFPASELGPSAIASLRGPFPTIPLIPTGGIALDAAATWTHAGAFAVGIGGPLLGDAPAGGDLEALTVRAERLMTALASRKPSSTEYPRPT